jgi:hypothetical protein
MKSAKETYLEYLDSKEGYDAYNKFKLWLYGLEDSLVQKIYQDTLKPLLEKHAGVFSVCDIGGGDGKRIIALLSKAHRDFPHIQFKLLFIEPSHAGFISAQRTFQDIADFSSIAVQNTTFENSEVGERFDLVLSIHSIFTFSQHETILKLLNLKTDTGKILIIANHPESMLARLNNVLQRDCVIKRYEVNDLLDDLARATVAYTVLAQETTFSILEEDFDRFSSDLLTWVSMDAYRDYSEEDRIKYKTLVRNVSALKTLHYKETEVFIYI